MKYLKELQRRLKRLGEDGILRSMLILATGTGLGKAIGIVAMPALTRIYSPEHFGILATFTAIYSILTPIGLGRYNVAIPLPKRDATAVNLAIGCFAILFVSTALIVATGALFHDHIIHYFGLGSVSKYWWLLIITLLGTCTYEILSAWALRKKSYTQLAKSTFWQSVGGTLVKIILGLLDYRPAGLMLGQATTQTAGVFSLAKNSLETLRKHLSSIRAKRVVAILRHYNEYPKYRLPSQFLLMFSMQAPLIFSARNFGLEAAGQLGLALMTLALPLTLVGNSVGQVFYAEISQIGKNNNKLAYELTKKTTKKLFILSLPPFIALIVFAPWLFSMVFGPEWSQAGTFAQILSIYLLTQFISSPIVNALNIFGDQKAFLKLNIIRSAGVILVFAACARLNLNPEATIAIYSIALSAHYTFTTFEIFKAIRLKQS